MDDQTHIRIELGIDARRFIQQVQINNERIEAQIAKGIELAISDLCDGDNFIQAVRDATKTEIMSIVTRCVHSYEIKKKIEGLIAERIGKKIEDYADKIAEQVTSSLT